MIGDLSQTYQTDLQLFEQLGLEPFNDVPLHRLHYVGKVEFDDRSYVKLHVKCYPAQFWYAEIYSESANRIHRIETGSGALVDFWPMFEQIAEGMVLIK